MKISIFGAGAVGSHIAARLARAGVDVSIIARAAHVDAIRERGLRFIDASGSFDVPVRATVDARELGPQDVVITAVKAHALPASVDSILPLLGPDTPVVYAVNGVPWWYFHSLPGEHAEHKLERLDPAGQLWNKIGIERAIGCVVVSSNEVLEPGVVRNNNIDNAFILGEPNGATSERLAAIEHELSRGLTKVTVTTDIRAAVWSKLVTNLPASSIACLTHGTSADAAENPDMRKLYGEILLDGVRIAAALGVEVPADIQNRLARRVAVRHRPSMLQDLEAGRPMEIDAQFATVRDLARVLSVPTPTFDVVAALLMQRARLAGLYKG